MGLRRQEILGLIGRPLFDPAPDPRTVHNAPRRRLSVEFSQLDDDELAAQGRAYTLALIDCRSRLGFVRRASGGGVVVGFGSSGMTWAGGIEALLSLFQAEGWMAEILSAQASYFSLGGWGLALLGFTSSVAFSSRLVELRWIANECESCLLVTSVELDRRMSAA